MSGPPSLSSAPLAYLEYEAGAAYPSITNLPPLSYSGPNGNGSMSSKAQALRDRLANAENDFDAGEDGDNYATAFSKTRSKQVVSNAAPPIVPASTARPPPITTPMYQTNSVNPISQLPTFQQSQGVNVLPSGSMQEENSMHAYAPPGWHQQVISQQQPIGHSPIQQPRIQQHIDPQIRKIVELLEARATQNGGSGIGKAQPDTTTEDLISLAFVGMFFMLAIHTLAPPVVYHR